MESAWVTLEKGISTAKSLDDVIKLHDAYLSDIVYRGLLTQTHEALNMQIQLLLQSIFRFCTLESVLLTDATISISRKLAIHEDRGKLSRNRKSSVDSTEDYNINDSLQLNDGVSEAMIVKVEEALKDYNSQFDILMKMLQVYDGGSEIIKFLTFRLNYNNFYNNQQKYT